MKNNTVTDGNTPIEAANTVGAHVDGAIEAEKRLHQEFCKLLQLIEQPAVEIPESALPSKKRAAKLGLQDLRAAMEFQHIQDKSQPRFDIGACMAEVSWRKGELENGDLASIDQAVKDNCTFMARVLNEAIASAQPTNDDESDETLEATRSRYISRLALAHDFLIIMVKQWNLWVQQCPSDFDRQKMRAQVGRMHSALSEMQEMVAPALNDFMHAFQKSMLCTSIERRDNYIAAITLQNKALRGVLSRMPIDQDSFGQSREGQEFTTGQIATALGFKDTTSVLSYIKRLEQSGKIPARPEEPQRTTKAKDKKSPGGHRKYSWPEVKIIVAYILEKSQKARDLKLESVLARL